MSAHPTLRVGALAAVTALGLAVLGATAAQAHVTVKPESTVAGGFTQLTFRVPNESDTASTTKLKVTLPSKTPLAYVSVLPVPGWTIKVTDAPLDPPVELEGTKITKAPHTITWTATGAGVKPGEYQNFPISAGPLPESGDLVFPAQQTYSDGDVVDWATVAKAGEDEPEHPAPAFTITSGTDGPAATSAAAATNVQSDDDDTATTIAVIGLIVGLVALVLAGVAVVRGRRTQES